MVWLQKTIFSSIGRKLLMAVTGLFFCLFLLGHLAGNLTLYGGKALFNSYAEHLHAMGPLVTLAEVGLLLFATIHVVTGLTLFFENLRARPARYCVNRSAGGRTIGSRTMPYTGFFMILFVLYHLANFHFVDKTNTTIFHIVSASFSNPLVMGFYILAMVVVALHVSHGLWSAFQTIGASHPKYMPAVMVTSVLFALVVGIGFGFLPIYVSMMG